MTKEAPIKILVASTSEHKKMAVMLAAKQVFGDNRIITVTGVKAPSDIQEQPLGLAMTTTGARNRFNHALAASGDYDYVVSMESGIMLQKLTPRRMYVDKAVVIAKSVSNGKLATEVSDGVTFPLTAVKEAKRRGFATTTVGAVLAEQNPGLDATDPHSFLTKGKHSRRDLLAAAVAKTLEKLK